MKRQNTRVSVTACFSLPLIFLFAMLVVFSAEGRTITKSNTLFLNAAVNNTEETISINTDAAINPETVNTPKLKPVQVLLTVTVISVLLLSFFISVLVRKHEKRTHCSMDINHYISALRNAFDEIYEYNVKTGMCHLIQNENHINDTDLNSNAEIKLKDMLHPEDVDAFEQKLRVSQSLSDEFDIEVRGKDGRGYYRWLNVYGVCFDISVYYLFFKNIDEEKNQKIQYINTERRLQLSLRDLYDEVFEINLINGDISFIKSCEESAVSGLSERYIDYINRLTSSVFPVEADIIKQKLCLPILRLAFVSGQDQIYVEFHKADYSGVYRWTALTLIRDTCMNAFVYIAFIQDIHERKHEIEQLQKRAELDTLTSLYNKGTTERLIRSYLTEKYRDSTHAFFIIDIDDFKAVNDKLGHAVGDLTLTEFASKLKKVFRCDDILGRIGGDEFVVFMKEITSHTVIEKKAREVCALFQQTYIDKEYSITGSVGVALYPSDGNTYESIYRNADNALYKAKRLGKNQYRFYSEA